MRKPIFFQKTPGTPERDGPLPARSEEYAAPLLGRAVGRPDNVHRLDGVGPQGLVREAPLEALDEVGLGRHVTSEVDLIVGGQGDRPALGRPGQADPSLRRCALSLCVINGCTSSSIG